MSTRPQLRRALLSATALAIAVMSCGREPAGPGDAAGTRYARGFALNPVFPAGYAQLVAAERAGLQSAGAVPAGTAPANQAAVAFENVTITLRNADGSIALRQVVAWPVGADEYPVTLTVPLPAGAPASGVLLALTLAYTNSAGQVVFTGGPVMVNVVPVPPGPNPQPPPPTTVTIPLTYTGPGATATKVVITPKTLAVPMNGAFSFTAVAQDAANNPVAGAPIVFSIGDGTLGTINPATGAGTAKAARGTTAVTAQLLTGPADGATLTVTPVASTLAAVSGTGQTANVNAALAAPVVVQVTALDGLTLAGVAVAFAAQNGGTVGSGSVTTGADGRAQTTWRLGAAVGAQTLTASAAGLTGSPVMFTATANALPPTHVEITAQPQATTAAGTAFGTTVRVVDATGNLVPTYAGAVSVALAAGAPPGALLTGTATVSAVAGLATFADLKLTVPGTYALTARSGSLIAATTATFRIVPGSAARLAFQNYPIIGATAGAVMDLITVVARDAHNNTAADFSGPVTLTVPGSASALRAQDPALAVRTTSPPAPSHVVLNQPLTVSADAGIATFRDAQLTVAGSYQLAASSPGLTSALGPSFPITPGPASVLSVVSGGGQTAASGSTLANPIVVRSADAYGNAVASRSVSFAPASGHGSASPTSATTNAAGLAQTTWTLAGAAGTKTLNVSGSGLQPNPLVVNATATGAAAPSGQPYGYPTEFTSLSGHSPHYLLGSLISVPAPATLTHLSVIGKVAGPLVKLALYTDVAGNPGTLVASTGALSLAVGPNEFAVSATSLPAGNYWIMGIYNVSASIGIDFANSDVVKYISLLFSSALPSTFPAPIVYTGQRFNYYIRVQ